MYCHRAAVITLTYITQSMSMLFTLLFVILINILFSVYIFFRVQ